MKKVEIKYSVPKLLSLFLTTFFFATIGYIVFSIGDEWYLKVLGWITFIAFGFGFALSVFRIFDRRPRIIIDDEGIVDVSLEVGKILWRDIEKAYPYSVNSNNLISLKVKNLESYTLKAPKYKRRLAKFNRGFGPETLNLNLICLEMQQDKVLALINKKI